MWIRKTKIEPFFCNRTCSYWLPWVHQEVEDKSFLVVCRVVSTCLTWRSLRSVTLSYSRINVHIYSIKHKSQYLGLRLRIVICYCSLGVTNQTYLWLDDQPEVAGLWRRDEANRWSDDTVYYWNVPGHRQPLPTHTYQDALPLQLARHLQSKSHISDWIVLNLAQFPRKTRGWNLCICSWNSIVDRYSKACFVPIRTIMTVKLPWRVSGFTNVSGIQ